MTTKQMEYVLELSRTKNFNRAADSLFISQPALTYQIKAVEEEIGFKIFERSGRGVSMTSAGAHFVIVLETVLDQLNEGVRLGQIAAGSFTRAITIDLPHRSAIRFLPEAVERFRDMVPTVPVTPIFGTAISRRVYGKIDCDITFSVRDSMKHLSGVKAYPLFESRIYCIMAKGDPLEGKSLITEEDLKERVLFTTNTRFPTSAHQVIRKVVQANHNINYLTVDVRTLLHQVACRAGIALVPGFINDRSGELVWIPYDTEETLSCVLLAKNGENRSAVIEFIELLQQIYKAHEGEDF